VLGTPFKARRAQRGGPEAELGGSGGPPNPARALTRTGWVGATRFDPSSFRDTRRGANAVGLGAGHTSDGVGACPTATTRLLKSGANDAQMSSARRVLVY
jgi:hypothetical protein